MTETSAERFQWKCLKTVDWQLQSPLISHCFFLSLLFSVHKLEGNHSGTILGEKCSRRERFKWKTLCQINGSHWVSLFTQSLSHPVSQSVKWTCRLFNTYRNEENIHVLKQQPRTHTRWGNLLIDQIFIRCKCGGKENDAVAVPEHLFPGRLTELLFTTCLCTYFLPSWAPAGLWLCLMSHCLKILQLVG